MTTIDPLPPIDKCLAQGARVMWVAPHPDDEFVCGQLLARATQFHGCALSMVILTRGEGGNNPFGDGAQGLAERRAAEMAAVAERYGATLHQGSFWNAPLPGRSFPTRDHLFGRWREDGDPVGFVAEQIRAFQPDLVVTFDPHWGATNHPEHQAAARVALAAVRDAASESGTSGKSGKSVEGHRVSLTVHALKRHPAFMVLGGRDPGPVDEWFDGQLPARAGQSSMDFLCEATKLHESQARDMKVFRRVRRLFERLALRHADPWGPDSLAPDEPVKRPRIGTAKNR